MCRDTAVFSAVGQMIVVLARSPGGLHVMIQLGVGEQQTAWCSTVSLPKEMLRSYRGSLCDFSSFFVLNHRAALFSSCRRCCCRCKDQRNKKVCNRVSPEGRDWMDLTGDPVSWVPRL